MGIITSNISASAEGGSASAPAGRIGVTGSMHLHSGSGADGGYLIFDQLTTSGGPAVPGGNTGVLFVSGNNGGAVDIWFKEPGGTSVNLSAEGDITAVRTSANSGLTGGGTSGDITLSVDSAIIPNLTASNAFSAGTTQWFLGNVNVSGSATFGDGNTDKFNVTSDALFNKLLCSGSFRFGHTTGGSRGDGVIQAKALSLTATEALSSVATLDSTVTAGTHLMLNSTLDTYAQAARKLLLSGTNGVDINSTNNGVINVGDGAHTGAINVGTGASVRTISIGNETGATALDIDTGTGGVTIDSQGAGTIAIGTEADAGAINIGVGASARTITVGNAASTAVNLNALASTITTVNALALTDGTATFQLGGTGATTLAAATTLDLQTTGNITIDSSAGTIGVGTDDVDENISIGTLGERTIAIGSGDAVAISLTGPIGLTGAVGLTGNITPSADMTYNLGTATMRFANIFTGDLNLRNDRGNWTLIEEAGFISFRNNDTGKRFKMLMEDITGDGSYGPGLNGVL